jgi:hypothetical protein
MPMSGSGAVLPSMTSPVDPKASLWQMSAEERDRYQEYFLQADENKDGFVSGTLSAFIL